MANGEGGGDTPSVPIGKIARQVGVTAQTIRNWSKRGLIPKPIRTLGGHRRYTPAQAEAIVQALKQAPAEV